MKTKIINVLPMEEIKFVKTISFDVDFCGSTHYAKVVYKRNPSLDYTMDETKRSKLDELMCYYPEECYPSDEIDKIILDGVKKKYPSAKVSTRLMLFDVEKEEITKELLNYKPESFRIQLNPHIVDINDIIESGKTQWRVFIKELPLYIVYSNKDEIFKYEGAILHYELDKEQELIDLEPKLLSEVTKF